MGYGKTLIERNVILPVPPGIVDGETVKVNIDPADDDRVLGTTETQQIFVTFRVDPSDYFTVEDSDLHSDATISVAQAIFGGKIKIDGLYGDEEVAIESGTDSHSIYKLANKGIKRTTGFGFGDHYVHINISIPK